MANVNDFKMHDNWSGRAAFHYASREWSVDTNPYEVELIENASKLKLLTVDAFYPNEDDLAYIIDSFLRQVPEPKANTTYRNGGGVWWELG